MNSYTSILLIVLVIGSVVHGHSVGTPRRSWSMVTMMTRQGPSEKDPSAQPWSLVRRRWASNGKTLEENLGRRKRQTFHDVFGDIFQHPSQHGTFNQDTHSCDEVLSRPCKRPSDCRGCLGLFTCHLPEARCDFKGVSKRTGIFYQNLQNDETSY